MKETKATLITQNTKAKLLILLKAAYFISGFILAVAISIISYKTKNFSTHKEAIEVIDLLERKSDGFGQNNWGSYNFNGEDI